ncbi:DNA-binding response OmpR family regulator [Algoriphagus sp. 4150]|uniref:response regulator transcription factor n=1 Tax=Algoriphagus sp. 4150 TaxID=2817756 RepID=UPI0028638CE4|nr:response regulator transcription factor [Algoriphagus sp. 4150]MDR7128605.1 DNA-binding response OmpR family regulator [Algoriphagus sp. 4150]
MKILAIEDEPELAEVIRKSLEKELYLVEHAEDFETAMEKISLYKYDCILLDIMLPGGSGMDILAELKKKDGGENVIIISAKDSLDDKLAGLDLGADDYLTKPFHIAELNARIKAVFRRKNLNGSNQLTIKNAVLDLNEREFKVDDLLLELNRKEFDILNYFMVNKNRLITKSALAEHVWGDHIDQADNFDFIYYQIKNLRKKLQSTHAQFEIQSIYGVGYKLVEL